VRNPSLRPWLCQRAGAVFVSGGEFVGAAREVILAQARSHPETGDDQAGRMISAAVWEFGSMVEVIVILSVLSAGIFLAHALAT
jgi:hypothetical protein